MNKTILLTGTLFGLLGIMLGAFGAHGLEKLVEPEAVDSFETGVRYQIYHAFFLLILGIWDGLDIKKKKIIFGFIGLGTLLFSFSIYLLAVNSLVSFDFKQLAFLTPIGGSILILGWTFFGFYILTKK